VVSLDAGDSPQRGRFAGQSLGTPAKSIKAVCFLTKMARYVVTGGLGFLGQYVVREILDRDPKARVMVVSRSRRKTLLRVLDNRRVEFVASDLSAERDFSFLQRGDMVVHAAALLPHTKGPDENMVAANVEATKRLALACSKHGVKRLLHVSSVAATERFPATQVTEDSFLSVKDLSAGEYALSKALSEKALRETTGLNYVICLPSTIAGPGDHQSEQLLATMRRLPIILDWGNLQNIIDVRDAAHGIWLLLRRGKRGERYLLTHHHVPLSRYMAFLASELGLRRPVLPVPRWVVRAARLPLSIYSQLNPGTAFTPELVNRLLVRRSFSNAKILALGMRFNHTLEQTVSDTALWLRTTPRVQS